MEHFLLKKVKILKFSIFLVKLSLSQKKVKVEDMMEIQREKTGCVKMRKKVKDFLLNKFLNRNFLLKLSREK